MNHRPVFFNNLIDRSSKKATYLRLHSPSMLIRISFILLCVVLTIFYLFFNAFHPFAEISFKGVLVQTGFVGMICFGVYCLVAYRDDKICDQGEQQNESSFSHKTLSGKSCLFDKTQPLSLLSPKRLVPLMLGAVFIAELGIMMMLTLLPPLSEPVRALFDASCLLLVISPIFYFALYRPILRQHQELKEMIDQLCVSEERYLLAVQAGDDSLWDCNLVTGDLYVSPRGATMLGFEPDEIESNIDAWRALLHPDEKDHVLAVQKEHLEGNSDHYVLEHRLKSKNGHWIWVLSRGQVVARGEDSQPLRAIGTHTDITQRKLAEESLRRREKEIRTLSHKLINTSEEEKKHLAQDLHDEFGQVLTAFKLEVEMLRNKLYGSKDEYLFHFDRLFKLISRLDDDLRTICDQLRPVMLDDVGLVATLRWHIREFMQQGKSIEVDFQINGQQSLSRELQIVLYRICQEGLNNVAKHAGPCNVDIALDLNPEHVSLTIQDNGRGIDDALLRNLNQASWGLGFLGMRERAAAVGGLLTVSSGKGQGVVIHAELPVCHTENLCHAN